MNDLSVNDNVAQFTNNIKAGYHIAQNGYFCDMYVLYIEAHANFVDGFYFVIDISAYGVVIVSDLIKSPGDYNSDSVECNSSILISYPGITHWLISEGAACFKVYQVCALCRSSRHRPRQNLLVLFISHDPNSLVGIFFAVPLISTDVLRQLNPTRGLIRLPQNGWFN